VSAGPLRILVVSTFNPGDANMVRDFLFSFNAYSRHRYYYVFNRAALEKNTDFSAFDVIVIFWSVFLPGPELSRVVRARIREAPAVKVSFLQDEYREVRTVNAAMRELGIQIVFTCVAEADHETFYPRSLIPTLEATYRVLPGYVPAYLERVPCPAPGTRPIDVGYRSRDQPYYLGDLGREKRIIAERFRAICEMHGLRGDISVAESDRLYGRKWIEFLRRSRCSLGTASGASVVDLTGTIRERCELYQARRPEATYDEVRARFFADVDGTLVIDTVSPRVFEAAALHSTLVHHEGGYGGVLEADEHYIRVERSYSNIDDVVARIKDDGFCRAMAARAHRDLVASGRYSYRTFVAEFDARLARHIDRPVSARPISRATFYRRTYRWHEPTILPRGAGHVVMPSPVFPLLLMGRVVGRLFRSHGHAASLFMRNPWRFMQMGHAASVMIVGTPCLRALLAAHFRAGRASENVPLARLVEDLVKIDIVRRARAGLLTADPSFTIGVAFEPEGGVLMLTSRHRDDDTPTEAAPLPAEAEEAVRDGRVTAIVWNHRAVGDFVVCELLRGRRFSVGLGSDVYSSGMHRFDGLSAVYARSAATAAALLTILRGDDGRELVPAGPGSMFTRRRPAAAPGSGRSPRPRDRRRSR